ncbi:hypothetical protein GDO81_018805 [Engystomops pustulosus]|uniref:catechol O-methyltransferase n=1 Tax=Engystomops pustulosus TaxID=76066 RepID=A0AAV6ZNL7_ENGPU|nr:hypothetical protein GDO81_018805 [Engystomops pustulosus]
MLATVLSVVAVLVGIVLLIAWRVRTNGEWALWWHDNYLERIRDFLSGTTRPIRILQYVQHNAKHGDPLSVITQYYSSYILVHRGQYYSEILDAVVLETRPRYVLELGTYCGYSTLRIARLLPPGARLITIEMNPHYAQVAKELFQHAGLDTQQRKWRLQEALLYTTLQCLQLPLQLFSRTPQCPLSPSSLPAQEKSAEKRPTGQTCKVELLVGSSTILIPQLKKKLDIEKFDLVFIDHWKVSYLPDTKLLEECGLLKAGCVLLADNVICPGTPDYLKYVRNSPHYKSQYFPSQLEYLQVEDGVEKSTFLG